MSKILHKIRAFLYNNYLTDNPNDYSARVASERSLGVKEICQLSVERGGADIAAASMQHGTELFLKEMAYQLCDGFSINTGYFTATPLIKGVFESSKENFNPDKHAILFQFTQGDTMRKEIPNISVEILGVAETSTEIAQVTDVKTGSVNDAITPNRNLKIIGSKLKIAGDNPNVGIALVDTYNEEDIRYWIDPSDIVVNNPSELIIILPDMSSGEQLKLRICTQFTGGSALLKEPRTAIFDKILTVQ